MLGVRATRVPWRIGSVSEEVPVHADTHRTRQLLLAVLLTLLALALLARPAHSGWGVDPVAVHATTALSPLVPASDQPAP